MMVESDVTCTVVVGAGRSCVGATDSVYAGLFMVLSILAPMHMQQIESWQRECKKFGG